MLHGLQDAVAPVKITHHTHNRGFRATDGRKLALDARAEPAQDHICAAFSDLYMPLRVLSGTTESVQELVGACKSGP